MINLIIGLLYSVPISLVALKKGSLSISGSIAAVVLGTGMYFFGGLVPSALMVVFFISSSILSKLNGKSKRKVDSISEKGSNRDFVQVFANGGVAFILSIIYYFSGNFMFLIAIAVSFAASNSDTWGSEIGVLSKKDPISILNFRPLESGRSGGISTLGTIASFAGAFFIGIAFVIVSVIKFGFYNNIFQIMIFVVLFGLAGSIIDSVLGAAIQAGYWDEINNRFTEKKYTNGRKNKLVKGFGLVNNDSVNILSNVLTVIISLTII